MDGGRIGRRWGYRRSSCPLVISVLSQITIYFATVLPSYPTREIQTMGIATEGHNLGLVTGIG